MKDLKMEILQDVGIRKSFPVMLNGLFRVAVISTIHIMLTAEVTMLSFMVIQLLSNL